MTLILSQESKIFLVDMESKTMINKKMQKKHWHL